MTYYLICLVMYTNAYHLFVYIANVGISRIMGPKSTPGGFHCEILQSTSTPTTFNHCAIVLYSALCEKPGCFIANRMPWLVVSKAFEKSKSINTVQFPESQLPSISFTTAVNVVNILWYLLWCWLNKPRTIMRETYIFFERPFLWNIFVILTCCSTVYRPRKSMYKCSKLDVTLQSPTE